MYISPITTNNFTNQPKYSNLSFRSSGFFKEFKRTVSEQGLKDAIKTTVDYGVYCAKQKTKQIYNAQKNEILSKTPEFREPLESMEKLASNIYKVMKDV